MFVRSSKFPQFLVLASLFVGGFCGHADTGITVINTCLLSGPVEFSENVFIQCAKTLKIAPGTTVKVTKDHTLTISVFDGIEYGSGSAFEAAGSTLDIEVEGTAMGVFNVDGGNVKIAYGSTYEYDQNLKLGETDTHEMMSHGKPVALAGPLLKPTTN